VCFDGKQRQELQRGDSVFIKMSENPVPTINRADLTTGKAVCWLAVLFASRLVSIESSKESSRFCFSVFDVAVSDQVFLVGVWQLCLTFGCAPAAAAAIACVACCRLV
jgi:hypothetical protein